VSGKQKRKRKFNKEGPRSINSRQSLKMFQKFPLSETDRAHRAGRVSAQQLVHEPPQPFGLRFGRNSGNLLKHIVCHCRIQQSTGARFDNLWKILIVHVGFFTHLF
jgi:hypothetical protein